jgi:mannosyltransferase OCH1-like enzyme
MFGRGGIYNDLDVHLIRPLPWNAMGPSKDGEGPPSLIIGLEGDASTKGLPRSPQFVQWTIASAPAHPVLKNVLDQIADETPSYLSKVVGKDGEIDVMNWTGPSVWTDAVLKYLACTDKLLQKLRDLKEPLRIKDVLVLPKRSFAVIQGEDHTLPDIFVKHYFSGTWKTCKKGWLASVISWRGC